MILAVEACFATVCVMIVLIFVRHVYCPIKGHLKNFCCLHFLFDVKTTDCLCTGDVSRADRQISVQATSQHILDGLRVELVSLGFSVQQQIVS